MSCRKYLFILMSITLVANLFGQVPTGKISGRVIDKATGKPLLGVNIIVMGTGFGAATDENGEYFILNLPPGKYDVSAQMIGYRAITVEDVQVFMDRTTILNFSLEVAHVEMSPLVVFGKRETIIKDLTSSSTCIGAAEIESAPVEGLRQIIELNAGLTQNPNGTYSIRGGPAFEVKFQVNGVEQITTNTGIPGFNLLGDRSNTSWRFDLNPIGIKQIEVITGGFNAEYGNAQSGVVKVVTKEGGEEFHGELRLEMRPPGKYHFGPYLYGKNTIEWEKWGNYENWVKWRDSNAPDINDDSLRILYEKWVTNHSPGEGNKSNAVGVYDYRKLVYYRCLFGLGGPIGRTNKLFFYLSGEYRNKPTRLPSNERAQVYQYFNLNLTYNYDNVNKFRFMLQYQSRFGSVWSGSDDIRWSSRIGQSPTRKYYLVLDPPLEEIITTQQFSWTHMFSERTYSEFVVWHQRERMIERNTPVIRPEDPWFVSPGPWDEGFYREPWAFTTLSALDAVTDVTNVSFAFTSQLTTKHKLKWGIKGQYWDTFYYAESGARINALVSYSGFAEYYHAYPYYFAAFIQDKIEFENMIANIGMRLDGFNMGIEAPIDRFRPFYPGTGMGGGTFIGDVGNPETRRVKTHVTLSPRFGLSFPIGDRTAFRLQYGYFYSMPLFRHALSKTTWQGWYMYGNPDLGPNKTISYEVGVQQSVGKHYRLDIAAYYNDRVCQTVSVRIHSSTGSQQVSPYDPYYISYENTGYGASKGIELNFEKILYANWHYKISYNLSRTTRGAYGAIDIYEDPDDPRSKVTRRSANDYITSEDRTHSFKALFSYHLPDRWFEKLLGNRQNTIKDVALSVIYTARSGTPFTYITSYDEFVDVTNNRRYPLETSTDFNLTANVAIFDKKLYCSLRVMNLFNNKWLTPIDSRDELRNWVEMGISRDTRPQTGDDPQMNIYKYKYFLTYRNVPREIYFSVGYKF